MSNKIIIIILTIGFASFSCKTVKYTKVEDSKEIKLPFEVKDYQDSDTELYSIQNIKGTNVSYLRTKVQSANASLLAFKIKTITNAIRIEKLEFNDKGDSSDLDQVVETISRNSTTKILLVAEKLIREKKGNEYDLWQVHKIKISDVISVINNSNIGFTVDNDDFKRKALIN
jgi:hypothetical protein|tara:strand:+ start:539 stop:1054 length:516 start_codon:yes stop_codon:yes gene_type:complete